MRKLPLILGIVAIGIGVIFVVFSLESTATTIPPPGSALSLSPNVVGSGSFTLTWSGAPSGTQVAFYHCGSSACAFTGSPTGCGGFPCTASGGPASTGKGASGSITSTVQSGDYYAVAEIGASSGVSATYSLVGLTFAILIGIVLMAVGAFLLFLARRAPKMQPAGMAEPLPNVSPPNEMIYGGAPPTAPPTVTATAVPGQSAMPESFDEVPSDGSTARRYFVQPTVPSEEEGGPPAAKAPAPTASTPVRQRPPLICPKCGTANDPWLTNCRRCQRSLRTTGTA